MDTIGSYMSVPVLSIESDASIMDVAKSMKTKNVGCLLIKDNEDYIGIVTETDLTRKVLGTGLNPKTTKVTEIMTQPILTLDGFVPVETANKFMAQNKVRHLAVTEEDKIVGMLSVRDLVAFYTNPRLRDSETVKDADRPSPFRHRNPFRQ
jgi:signal-transduction protein with cAMP-binding, CBS, and nucleotidyltransferase domain